MQRVEYRCKLGAEGVIATFDRPLEIGLQFAEMLQNREDHENGGEIASRDATFGARSYAVSVVRHQVHRVAYGGFEHLRLQGSRQDLRDQRALGLYELVQAGRQQEIILHLLLVGRRVLHRKRGELRRFSGHRIQGQIQPRRLRRFQQHSVGLVQGVLQPPRRFTPCVLLAIQRVSVSEFRTLQIMSVLA